MNVSSIKYSFPEACEWQLGDDLAYFEFGSTVVLLTENNTFTASPNVSIGTKVKMGQTLGHFK
ncbi:phosphatidylserine decarboxylase [compost metagenome]